MLLHTNDYYQSSLLASLPGITHGYSTRSHGDMRLPQSRELFYRLLHIDPSSVVRSEQVHGARVAVVNTPISSPVLQTDGVIVSSGAASVVVGDCVPLLLADSETKRVAAVHAGWKGTRDNIMRQSIQTMVDSGSKKEDIYIAIGPRIGMCCYTVPEDRAEEFKKLYGLDERMLTFWDETWHLDIGYVNYLQAMQEGIKKEHIDIQPLCTSCQIDRLFSYRKDTKESFGEIIGVIGVQ